jgi:hypothetical protein
MRGLTDPKRKKILQDGGVRRLRGNLAAKCGSIGPEGRSPLMDYLGPNDSAPWGDRKLRSDDPKSPSN